MGNRRLLTGAFWGDAAERMIRAAAASALGMLGADQVGILDVAWSGIGSVAAMAAVASLLASIVAGTTTDPETAGFSTTR
ncbi:holin [Nonomuraea sp. NPDC050643]|uniref:holin n=1 Tax=Nonomuraea sp. NPDC050643 TaxID=3155660 RepID=UPI0034079345